MKYSIIYTSQRLCMAALISLVLSGCTNARPSEQAAKPSTDWREVKPGLVTKTLQWPRENTTYRAVVFLLNKNSVQWELSYNPQPKRLQDWLDITQADLVINGGFFTETYEPTGLFRVDGETRNSQAYDAPSVGMISIVNGQLSTGAGVTDSEAESIFQSFPYLIHPGGVKASIEESGKIARRTIIGSDETHDVVIIFDSTPVSLSVAAELLADTGLNLDWALNLDGGPSTGLIAKGESETVSLLPAAELPIVLSATIR